MISRSPILIVFVLLGIGSAVAPVPASEDPFRIEVVDENGWPVPVVELRTTHGVSFFTDNAGVVAVDLPEVMNRDTWFFIDADGYEAKADGFGYRGVRLRPVPAGSARVEISRTGLARRLGRLTGAGIFGESQKLGERTDWKESGIFGSDSIQVATYGGRIFWLWGDSHLSRYPLGIFDCSSATSPLRPLERFEPPLALELDYFRDEKGIPRGVADLEGEGPTWLTGMTALPDVNGKERLVATYAKIKPPLSTYRSGLCAWDDETENFESVLEIWRETDATPQEPPSPTGHPSFWTDEKGTRWALFGNPFPTLRVEARYESWIDPKQWIPMEKPGTLPADTEKGKVIPHSGSMDWCASRQRWIAVFVEKGGKPSPLGEVWIAEATSPFGPWDKAIKVLSHRHYTFYNPRLRLDLAPEDAGFLLFEGTYTHTFSGNPVRTPRHDYNQILYRVDFADLDSR